MNNESAKIAQLIEESRSLIQGGCFAAALQRAEAALRLACQQGDPAAEAEARVCASQAEHRLGCYEKMRQHALRALELVEENTSTYLQALLLLTGHAMELGQYDEMECYALRANDLARRLDLQEERARALHYLSQVYGLRGQFDLQLAADQEAYQILKALNQPSQAISLIATMFCYLRIGRIAEAKALEPELIQSSAGNPFFEGYVTMVRAMLHDELGSVDRALDLYNQARSLAEQIGDPALQIMIRWGLSRYYRATGQASLAMQWAEDALAWARRSSNWRWLGRTLIEHAQAAWMCGDVSLAERQLRAGMDELAARRQAFDLTHASLLMAVLLDGRGDPQARDYLQQALDGILKGGYACLLAQERHKIYPMIARHIDDQDEPFAQNLAQCLEYLAQVPPLPLTVYSLGNFEVWQGGRRIDPQAWQRRQAGELFRLLLVSPRHSLTREEVMEALWPDREPASGRSLFHQATSTLRRILEPELPRHFPARYLTVDEGLVSLRLPPGSWVDFEEFETQVKAGNWEEAVRLYQGPLYPYDRYADWAAVPCERLRILAIQAFLEYARQVLHQGLPRQALWACQRVLEMDAWNELATEVGMQACLALQDRSGAIRLYQELARSLRQDLNIEPQPNLRRFYEALRNAENLETEFGV